MKLKKVNYYLLTSTTQSREDYVKTARIKPCHRQGVDFI